MIRLCCQPAIVDGHGSRLIRSLGQLIVLNIDMGQTDALTVGHNPDMNMKINTESPLLAVTPGEWYTSDLLATTRTGFRQMDDILHVLSAVKLDCSTVWGFTQIDSATVFRRTSFPCARTVTGSLLFGSSHRLVRSCLALRYISELLGF